MRHACFANRAKAYRSSLQRLCRRDLTRFSVVSLPRKKSSQHDVQSSRPAFKSVVPYENDRVCTCNVNSEMRTRAELRLKP